LGTVGFSKVLKSLRGVRPAVAYQQNRDCLRKGVLDSRGKNPERVEKGGENKVGGAGKGIQGLTPKTPLRG